MSAPEGSVKEKDVEAPPELESPPGPDGQPAAIPEELPLLPLKGTVLFPGLMIPLTVGRPSSIRLVDDALQGDKSIAFVAQRDAKVEDPKPEDLYAIGTAGVVEKLFKMPDESVRIIVRGLSRIAVSQVISRRPYLRARVRVLKDEEVNRDDLSVEAMAAQIRTDFNKISELSSQISPEMGMMALNITDPGLLADFVGSTLDSGIEEKQDLLETRSVQQRLHKVLSLMTKELQLLELGRKIHDQMRATMDKTQREYYLREQLKAIQKELGEEDEHGVEMEELREKIAEAGMPEGVEKEALRELDRLSRMSPGAAEYTVSRTYLDWLVELPWAVQTEDRLDIEAAEAILNEDHFGLEKVKKRILEFLSVRKLKKDIRGPILCFVGPPGVGKTSLGRSIARALGRKFVRISLGGARDEAEIRGHRRTYIGALPGRIIQGVRKAGSSNPVFMLDEVDKLGADFRGDPSAALLEVLDPEQNQSFVDHYLDVPYDLSKVMFIMTANVLMAIPPALRDRMEVLELPGYTEEEKLGIAKHFLTSKQLDEHGIRPKQLSFSDEALREIINGYTREAGLRNLDREIAAICRAVAKEIAGGRKKPVTIRPEDVASYLGPRRFHTEMAERTLVPGVATGLAWTPSGGDIIFVEATGIEGGSGLILTGQLGDVMKESAMAALSYIRSHAKALGLRRKSFENVGFHVHVPARAIPKDGPSAGVTMFTALLSFLTGRAVKPDVAMTGEITLRGSILPVGGIKEKVLAASRAGVRTVILAADNERDLIDVPENVREEMKFRFVKRMEELPPLVLRPKARKPGRAAASATKAPPRRSRSSKEIKAPKPSTRRGARVKA
ncbi:MAG: endopeptidase La [Nitrospinota bacterium]